MELPVGKWYGLYFSEQSKFTQINGYKIRPVSGYTFNRQSDIFENCINDVYNNELNTVIVAKDPLQKV